MSRFRQKHRHFQYLLDLNPDMLSQIKIKEEQNSLDIMWVKAFCAEKRVCQKDPFWVSITNYDVI